MFRSLNGPSLGKIPLKAALSPGHKALQKSPCQQPEEPAPHLQAPSRMQVLEIALPLAVLSPLSSPRPGTRSAARWRAQGAYQSRGRILPRREEEDAAVQAASTFPSPPRHLPGHGPQCRLLPRGAPCSAVGPR